jgi:hypothetical protein
MTDAQRLAIIKRLIMDPKDNVWLMELCERQQEQIENALHEIVELLREGLNVNRRDKRKTTGRR